MTELQGFLTKEGINFRTWKKRWFVVKQGAIYYSKNKDGPSLGFICLSKGNDIRSVEYKKKKYVFQVATPERTYYLQAESDEDRDNWVTKLNVIRETIKEDAKAPKLNLVGIEDFNFLAVIGRGSFGKVYQVEKKNNHQIYAMKVLKKKFLVEQNEVEHIKAEKNILQNLVHPFLVNLYYSFQTEDKICFVMDYINGGEFFFHLKKEKRFTEPRARFYVAEILLGLEYLHRNGVIYRDLKPENILLTEDGHVCMTDFGIAKEGMFQNERTSTLCGTPEYLAPEILEGKEYGASVDWWSLGILTFEMLVGYSPFYCEDIQKMYIKIMTEKIETPQIVSKEAGDLILSLLEKNPETRLTDPTIVKQHIFFKEINWEKLLAKEVKPPFIPRVKSKKDTRNIDKSFTSEAPRFTPPEEDSAISQSLQENFQDFAFVSSTSSTNR